MHFFKFSSVFFSQKTKALEAPQRFVELFLVVDNTEVNMSDCSFHSFAEYISSRLRLLLLQSKRFGKETKSRILEVVNHIDKVTQLLMSSFLDVCDS